MAAPDATEIVVGANGSISVAPVGTANPTTPTGALNASFKNLGYVSDDGVTFADGKTVEDIGVWQGFYAARRVVTGKATTLSFALRQWDEDTVPFAFGGGTLDKTTGIYTPPAPGSLDYREIVLEWIDGAYTYRLVIPRGEVTGEVSSVINKNAAADLPIEVSAVPAGLPTPGVTAGQLATQAWYLISNAPALKT